MLMNGKFCNERNNRTTRYVMHECAQRRVHYTRSDIMSCHGRRFAALRTLTVMTLIVTPPGELPLLFYLLICVCELCTERVARCLVFK